jgi:uncharacterized membrane protein
MTTVRMKGHFDAPIERVFELGSDFKRYPEWNAAYSDIKEVIGPPDKVGTRILGVTKVLGRHMEGWGDIVEVDPPRLLKVSGKGLEGGTVTTTYRYTPAGTGTDYEFEGEYELPAGFLGQIADKLFVEKAVERDLRHSIENFKALVEAKTPVLA